MARNLKKPSLCATYKCGLFILVVAVFAFVIGISLASSLGKMNDYKYAAVRRTKQEEVKKDDSKVLQKVDVKAILKDQAEKEEQADLKKVDVLINLAEQDSASKLIKAFKLITRLYVFYNSDATLAEELKGANGLQEAVIALKNVMQTVIDGNAYLFKIKSEKDENGFYIYKEDQGGDLDMFGLIENYFADPLKIGKDETVYGENVIYNLETDLAGLDSALLAYQNQLAQISESVKAEEMQTELNDLRSSMKEILDDLKWYYEQLVAAGWDQHLKGENPESFPVLLAIFEDAANYRKGMASVANWEIYLLNTNTLAVLQTEIPEFIKALEGVREAAKNDNTKGTYKYYAHRKDLVDNMIKSLHELQDIIIVAKTTIWPEVEQAVLIAWKDIMFPVVSKIIPRLYGSVGINYLDLIYDLTGATLPVTSPKPDPEQKIEIVSMNFRDKAELLKNLLDTFSELQVIGADNTLQTNYKKMTSVYKKIWLLLQNRVVVGKVGFIDVFDRLKEKNLIVVSDPGKKGPDYIEIIDAFTLKLLEWKVSEDLISELNSVLIEKGLSEEAIAKVNEKLSAADIEEDTAVKINEYLKKAVALSIDKLIEIGVPVDEMSLPDSYEEYVKKLQVIQKEIVKATQDGQVLAENYDNWSELSSPLLISTIENQIVLQQSYKTYTGQDDELENYSGSTAAANIEDLKNEQVKKNTSVEPFNDLETYSGAQKLYQQEFVPFENTLADQAVKAHVAAGKVLFNTAFLLEEVDRVFLELDSSVIEFLSEDSLDWWIETMAIVSYLNVTVTEQLDNYITLYESYFSAVQDIRQLFVNDDLSEFKIMLKTLSVTKFIDLSVELCEQYLSAEDCSDLAAYFTDPME